MKRLMNSKAVNEIDDGESSGTATKLTDGRWFERFRKQSRSHRTRLILAGAMCHE
ncbi:hypothetical protein KIN20_034272 [Parelaphostrongylus tenuis]|uniref:Uncharacterized protein n=1 Tax=Parelaphostrongylus tenuis TaxID=148309 RepID=A0AAD5WIW8_PARTN|nr:hypothetical protein KIN20_034272 [Parelaphostrongylus tenuis]